jgi:hypothetical protein
MEDNFIPWFFIWVVIILLITVWVMWIVQVNYEKHPETSKEYREWYCKALNWDRIEWTLCVDKENKTLYIFKTGYE